MIEFFKVKKNQFLISSKNLVEEKDAEAVYSSLLLPKRATDKSVGYDFFTYFSFSLNPGEEIKIPTGIKVCLKPFNQLIWLGIYPRSSLGFKHLKIANTVGVIDADYFENPENDGEIFVKLRNESLDKQFSFSAGDAFCQGIIQPALLTSDDAGSYKGQRIGGLGSTS